jgi:glutathione S-transferase
MKIHMFPPSGRVVGIVALKNYLALDCDLEPIDLGRGDQRTPEYAALNLNRKVPALEDDGIVLWESNAILFYMASKRPESGVWPPDVMGQSNVLRWLFWEGAHWDAESVAWSHTRRVRRMCSASAHPTRPSSRVGSKNSAASQLCLTTP